MDGSAEPQYMGSPTAQGQPAGAEQQTGMGGLDGIEIARRMVLATESAAAAAQAAVQAASRSSDESRAWWKLLPKPALFDHATREAEIAGWKDWSWSFEQYMSSVDSKFMDDIRQVRSNTEKPIDTFDFSDAERQRNSFFYSLLSSLMRQRALLVVKQVPGNNGLEAYRLLVAQNEPANKNRAMSLLNTIMNWPAFNSKMSLMQNVLRLEHAFSEYERLGTALQDDLKTAILLRSVTGQLKVWLQLQVGDGTTYMRVREMIMMYDASTVKWSEAMVLGAESSGNSADGPVPMEIDRIEKGKSKGQHKGKSKEKGQSKGKSKGKNKGKDVKGKGKSFDGKGSKGNAFAGSKGKGKNEPKQCYNCGRTGHMARDCWNNPQVRNVNSDVMPPSTTVQGSPASSLGGMSTASHQVQHGGQQQPVAPVSSTQYKVSRIQIEEISDDVELHDDLIFDMRSASPSSFHGSVHALYYYMGDSDVDCDECCFDGAIRTVVDSDDACGNSCDETYTILLDSGADASIFPASLVNKGTPVCGSIGKLHDAQGAEIPVQSIQDMEIRLRDLSGRNVLLRERVAISDRVTQPIVCFGHLLESGWGIDGAQQTLVHHSADARVPLELQKKSMVVRGTIRVMSEWIPADNSLHVRAIRADVFDEKLVSGTVGWELDERGCGTGRHFANKYQDPSLVRPDMPGRFCRTTLVQGDDKKWYVLELCERLDGLVQLDTEFHGMHGNRNVVTVITDGDKDPRVMGFALADEQPEQFPVVAEDVEDVEIPADDMPVEGQEIPEGRIVVQPSPEDEVNVNGTILHPTSSLAALRAGCSHTDFHIRFKSKMFSASSGSCKEVGIRHGFSNCENCPERTGETSFGTSDSRGAN